MALLTRPQLGCLLEAHDALSAVIAQEAGVEGVWASSLTMSCANGHRDDNSLGMDRTLAIVESMTERLEVPVLVDADTGYGSFAHTEILARRLIARGAAGMCIEDKRLPKRNSFLHAEQQRLAPVEEFCGKLRAAAHARAGRDFILVARTEALIVGLGVREALRRARAYAEAGADALLVHSKAQTFAPVAEFMEAWDARLPVICVPTTYASTSVEDFERAGLGLVIWANHMLRASVVAMRELAERVAQHRHIDGAPPMTSVSELLRLQDTAGLVDHERRFGALTRRAVVLDGPCDERVLHSLRAVGWRDLVALTAHAPEGVEPLGEIALASALDTLIARGHNEVILWPGNLEVRPGWLRELTAHARPLIALVAPGGTLSLERRASWQDLARLSDGGHGHRWLGALRASGGGLRALSQRGLELPFGLLDDGVDAIELRDHDFRVLP